MKHRVHTSLCNPCYGTERAYDFKSPISLGFVCITQLFDPLYFQRANHLHKLKIKRL
ncbi:unnamed protein product [Camellia sinensis]